MPEAFVVLRHGDYKVLELRTVVLRDLNNKEVVVRHTYVGLNFIDCQYRAGFYQVSLPLIPGNEAVGIIEQVGTDVKDFKIGDRVCYCTAPFGAYATHRVIHVKYLMKLPRQITDEVAISCLMKGMVAHMLIKRVYVMVNGLNVLVHNAAGGVGHILCQWLKNEFLCNVIGTVGSDSKKEIALKNGCDVVFNYNDNFANQVDDYTSGRGVIVAFDSIGRLTFEESLNCLSRYGLFVLYGQSSGLVSRINMIEVGKKSLYITKPSLFHYKATPVELKVSIRDLFISVVRGNIKPIINKIYDFTSIPRAQSDLENRLLSCSNIIKINYKE